MVIALAPPKTARKIGHRELKSGADGMRAIIDESGGAVGWRATGSASWPQQLDLAIAG
jgi:hypothetical protein